MTTALVPGTTSGRIGAAAPRMRAGRARAPRVARSLVSPARRTRCSACTSAARTTDCSMAARWRATRASRPASTIPSATPRRCASCTTMAAKAPPATRLCAPCRKGVSAYQNGNLLLCRVGGWRATVSACDFVYADGGDNGGGSLTLLWHERLGPLCAATMARYTPVEPHNMQYLRNSEETYCLTPHIESGEKLSVCDRSARLTVECAQADCVRVAAQGAWFSFRYEFTPETRPHPGVFAGGRHVLPAHHRGQGGARRRAGGRSSHRRLRMRADGAFLLAQRKIRPPI